MRKPVIQNQSQAASKAIPYPITPASPSQKQEDLVLPIGKRNQDSQAPQNAENIEAFQDPNPWSNDAQQARRSSAKESIDVQLPSPLQAGNQRQSRAKAKVEGLPPLLQAGSTEATPRSSLDSQRSTDPTSIVTTAPAERENRRVSETSSAATSTNPYHRPHSIGEQVPAQTGTGAESSADIWNDGHAPAPLHQEQHLPQKPFTRPWIDFGTSPVEQSTSKVEAPLNDSVNGGDSSEQTTGIADSRAADAPILDIQSPEQETQPQPFNAHDFTSFQANGLPRKEPLVLGEHLGRERADARNDTYQHHLHQPYDNDIGPPLPPRISGETQEQPPPQPPRPPKTNDVQSDDTSLVQTQRDESAKSKGARETYQIRHVNWYDISSKTNPRRSPIMVQNANGPCPLLALVNALVLSTPADYATALVETLRVREQISLGLLLDAVIDELIGRNGDLSDVSDMYAFLVNLHTGMNVNPRFIPLEAAVNLMDAPIEEELPGNLHDSRKAGGFEETREMKLYKTFAIPLIHGWIPPRNHPAFAALKRSAKTYEDAQNLMFREEELEEKLRQQGLQAEEQMTLEDIASVKFFLSSTATQLTGYGLDTMTDTMAPGSVAILFRNDHFSTLYRHPKTGQLFTLVTDMGYAGHDEVVWESLVDVSGEGCEFFSGDFRPVGNSPNDAQQQSQSQSQAQDADGWTTVNKRTRRPGPTNRQSSHTDLPPLSTLNLNEKENPLSSSTEQEDHDLALAMQLQEEEEERDRQEAAARRREDELSQAYLNSSDASGRRTFPGFSSGARASRGGGGEGGPTPPPRGRGSGRYAPTPSPAAGAGRPPAQPRKSVESEDLPPPTYEQAAKGPAYHPPNYHPAHPNAPPTPMSATAGTQRPPNRPHRQSSAYSEHASSYGGPSSPSPYGPQRRDRNSRPSAGAGAMRGGGGVDPNLVRRRSGGAPLSAASSSEDERRDRDCVVM